MNYTIQRKIIDLAGKTRIWVDLVGGGTVMLKFQTDPTDKEVQGEVDRYVADKSMAKEKELEIVNQQIGILTEQKARLETDVAKEKEIIKQK